MHVRMLEDRPITVDGVQTIEAKAGEIYKMGAGVAGDLIEQGLAELADGIAKIEEAAGSSRKPKRTPEQPPEIPVALTVSPSFVTFTGTAGVAPDPASAASIVVNKPNFIVGIPTDADWLTCGLVDGGFTLSRSTLDAGTYSATVSVNGHDDEETTVSVSVSIAAAAPAEASKAIEEPLENKDAAAGKKGKASASSSSSKKKTASRTGAKKATRKA